jgi:hypothetical protein
VSPHPFARKLRMARAAGLPHRERPHRGGTAARGLREQVGGRARRLESTIPRFEVRGILPPSRGRFEFPFGAVLGSSGCQNECETRPVQPCAPVPAHTNRMARKTELSDYEKLLGSLEGDAFEAEVCALLQIQISDFQRIPDKPNGDGGLDGLSHGQECGYCCYGPEQDPVKLKDKGLKGDIIEKFNADLRKLFELRFGDNRRLTDAPNPELGTIIGEGNKLVRDAPCYWPAQHRPQQVQEGQQAAVRRR